MAVKGLRWLWYGRAEGNLVTFCVTDCWIIYFCDEIIFTHYDRSTTFIEGNKWKNILISFISEILVLFDILISVSSKEHTQTTSYREINVYRVQINSTKEQNRNDLNGDKRGQWVDDSDASKCFTLTKAWRDTKGGLTSLTVDNLIRHQIIITESRQSCLHCLRARSEVFWAG